MSRKEGYVNEKSTNRTKTIRIRKEKGLTVFCLYTIMGSKQREKGRLMNEKELEITATLAETIPGLDEAAREFLLGRARGWGSESPHPRLNRGGGVQKCRPCDAYRPGERGGPVSGEGGSMTVNERILEFIREYTRTEGRPPAVRDIGREVGKSPSVVKAHLDRLVRDGKVRRRTGRPDPWS